MTLTELMYKLKNINRGLKSLNKTFYPKKPHNCKNCSLIKYDGSYNEEKCYIFPTKITNEDLKPTDLCMPIKDNTNISGEFHADCISIQIVKLTS